ncbi:hypothetical protein RJ640_015407 [Escallonia rubra]|uniref:Transposase (putative) gypsy type domain-containing protein n=1 Tax=Escallonia rubra TaxID=112253 RepID=A0AA88UBB0_9ASTE|nr:hypothetical protein RJ640_015407 [Escallonia rubra]
MSTEDLQNLLRKYPLPEGWYAQLPGLGEPANYGTKFETGVYEEQVKSGYRLPLHPFALRFFEHYRMAPGQLVPNGWRKLAGLIYLVQTSGYKPDATDFMRVFFEICFVKGVANCPGMGELPFDRVWNPFYEPLSNEQLEWAKIIPPKPIPAGLQIPLPRPAIHSLSSADTVPLEMASGSGKSQQGGFFGVLQKAKGKQKEKQPSVELPPTPKRTRVTPLERSPWILEQVSIEDDPIFRPRWTLRRDDLGMPDSQVSEQHLLHGILPRDKEVGAAEEAQLKREAVKEAQEATHCAEELSKQEADHLTKIVALEKRLDRVKRKAAEEANEMFVKRFPDMSLDDFVMPAVVSQSGDTAMPSEAGDAAASHLPGEGLSGDAPEA